MPDFNAYYTRKLIEKANRNGIARTATGNKLARLAFALTKHEMLYRPRTLDSLTSNLRGYYVALYGKILKKLDRFSSEKILPEDNYLKKIKQKLERQYAVDLSKLSESI